MRTPAMHLVLASAIGPRLSTCASGSTSRAATSTPRLDALPRRGVDARGGRAVDVQPVGDLRRERRSRRRRATSSRPSSATTTTHRRRRFSRTCSRSKRRRRRGAHLFRVAAGLDSLVVGEPQILGQVKDAYQTLPRAHDASGPSSATAVPAVVRRREACADGNGARRRGGIGQLRRGRARAKDLRRPAGTARVLVVGAGEISTLTAQHLRAQGVGEIVITSRTHAHAERTRRGRRGSRRAMGRNEQRARLRRHRHHGHRFAAAHHHARTARGGDAASRRSRRCSSSTSRVPRDVEPAVGEIEQVFLYNIDDLQTIVEENLSRRVAEVEHAESIVNDEVAKFMAWQRSRSAVPTVVALRQRFEAIRRSELQRLEGKLGGLSSRGARARRRGDAPHRREAAPRADRTAQGHTRRSDGGPVLRSPHEALRSRFRTG